MRALVGSIAMTAWLMFVAFPGSEAYAQAYPNKPIRVIVPLSPGGAVDNLARPLANHLGGSLGKPVIVDNRPGANGIIGSDIVAKAAPDGYTLLMPDLGSLTVGPAVTPNMPFDAAQDFAPITMLAFSPYGYAVNPSLPVKSMAELITYAKANPGKLNFATLGSGSASHLAGIDLAARAGIAWTYIPYKGGGQALPEVVAGNAHLIGISLTSTLCVRPFGAAAVAGRL